MPSAVAVAFRYVPVDLQRTKWVNNGFPQKYEIASYNGSLFNAENMSWSTNSKSKGSEMSAAG